MKKWMFFLLMSCFVLHAGIIAAQSYRPVDNGSAVTVTVKNLGMGVDGKMTGLNGNILFNPADLKTASFSVTIDASTISTGIDVRDAALQGEDFLNTKIFPVISFVSKQITQVNKSAPYVVKGTLTIKGISKEIMFPFSAVPKDDGMLFAGEMKINRLDFKIDTASTVLSNSITIALSIFAKKS